MQSLAEREFEISTPEGDAEAWLLVPADGGPRPGVLLFTDIFGLRPAVREQAARIAAAGYAVLVPNVLFRHGRPPFFAADLVPGDERFMRRIGELTAPLTPEVMERDALAYLDCLGRQPEVAAGGMGVVGVCFSGAMALRAAAASPERVTAMASFHGGRLWRDDASSPHRVLPRVKARLVFCHADNDSSMPAEAITQFEEALRSWGAFESETYTGARHGWTMSDRAIHHPEQAEHAMGRLLALLGGSLSA